MTVTQIKVPFNKPCLVGKEMQYIAESVLLGQISGDGEFTKRCQKFIEEQFLLKKVLLTTSCTSALDMAALLLDLQPGDEVIAPSFTFVSTVNCFVLRGAHPVFIDIRKDTLNIDETKVEAAITPRTKAIFVVHYGGVGCEMEEILAIATRHNLVVVEDAAQGIGAKYKARFLGSMGVLAAYSFHETKNVMCGEGGALVINEPSYIQRAEIVREKGTNRTKFFRGEIEKYTWVDVGSSYLPSDLLASFLLAQFERIDEIIERRCHQYNYYLEKLTALEIEGKLCLPHIPNHCTSNYHIFYILLPDSKTRIQLMTALGHAGIEAPFHYVPLHTSEMGRKYGYQKGDLPITESVSSRLLRLPLFFHLTLEQQSEVVRVISDCLS